MLEKLAIVGVMGSGTEAHETLATEIGEALATLPVHLLTGGGAGVMTSVCKAFTNIPNRKGRTIGIIPTEKQPDGTFASKPGYPNPYIEIPIFTPLGTYAGEGTDIISRNFINIMTANAVVALPGSGGTQNEINLAVKYNKPICLYGEGAFPPDFRPQLLRFSGKDQVMQWIKDKIS
ncbi:MAG: DNA-binding protein [Proteobacteria bacterium]|nr:DNA-binding protein [Pseudomonadota bacterium]